MTSCTTGLLTTFFSRWSGPLVWVRLLRILLWLTVVAGPVLAVVAVVQVSKLTGQIEEVARAGTLEVPGDTRHVEGFAELFVASYLIPDGDASSVPGSSEGGGQRWRLARTVSLGTEQVADGYFAVTVAADMAGTQSESASASETFVYRVGVAETDQGLAAVGPPALLAAPAVVPPLDLLVDPSDGLEGVPGLEEALTRFLSAYLAGEGELARYVAPGSSLVPVVPPPFRSVEILDAGSVVNSESSREVVVVVEGVDDQGWVQVLQYGLVVAEREGRWEVADLLAAPSIDTSTE
jgi:hypothetical protein